MTARVLIGLALGMLAGVTGDLAVTTVVARHDAEHAAPVQGAAPGPMESAT